MAVHDLKIWPDFFEAVARGDKPFELRKCDRPFAKGDFLRLKEWLPESERYTGRELTVQITYMVTGAFGLQDGYSCLGIKPCHF